MSDGKNELKDIVAILLQSPLPVVIYRGKDEVIVACNQAASSALDFETPKQLIGRSLLDFVPDEWRKEGPQIAERRMKGEQFIHYYSDFEFITGKGRPYRASGFSCTIWYEDGYAGLILFFPKEAEYIFQKLYAVVKAINNIIILPDIPPEEKLLDLVCYELFSEAQFYGVGGGKVDHENKCFTATCAYCVIMEAAEAYKRAEISVDPAKPSGRGGVGRAYHSKDIVVIEDVLEDEGSRYWRPLYEKFGALSVCTIPIVLDGRVEYIIQIYEKTKCAFSGETKGLLKDIQHLVTLAFTYLRSERERIFKTRVNTLLNHLLKGIIQAKSEEEIYTVLAENVVNHLGIPIVTVLMIKDGRIHVASAYSQKIEDMIVLQSLREAFEGIGIDELPERLGVKRAILENRIISKPMPSEEEVSYFPERIKKCPYTLKAHGMKSCCSIPIFEEKEPKSVILMFYEDEDFLRGVEDVFYLLKEEVEFVLNSIKREMFLDIILTAVQHGFEFVSVMDKDFRILFINRASLERFGYTPEEVLGKHHSMFSSKLHDKEFVKRFYQTVTSGEVFSDYFIYRAKDGSLIHSHTTVVPIKRNGVIEYYVGVGKDITREKALLERLDYLLTRDALTDLLNTRGFLDELQKVLDKYREKGEIVSGALIVLNPLEFENINRAFGYRVGERILLEIAKRLKETVYKTDILARLDSYHFAVFSENIKDASNSIVITQRIIGTLEEPYIVDNQTIKMNFVAGISIYPEDGTDAQTLLDKAKVALAEAEASPRKIGFYSPILRERAFRGIRLRDEIERAMENRELVFFYQPYVDGEGIVVGCECLVRWIKRGEVVPPAEFIPFLEETGLIVKVEEYLTELFIERVLSLCKIGNRLKFSINISPISIMKGNSLKILEEKLRTCPGVCRLVNIEIVERSFLDLSNTEGESKLFSLKKCGVSLTIDDFGTGYSALSYITHYPIDYLKIDISFTRKVVTDVKTKGLVSAIVNLCKTLNIKTIAEGVETEEQFKLLQDLGCDYFQGFLFYKPMDEESFLKLTNG